MTPARPLEQFVLEETEAGYLITMQADDGRSLTVEASPEQLDAIIEAFDDLLSEDDDLTDGYDDES